MNLKTILTIKNMSFNERFNRIKELVPDNHKELSFIEELRTLINKHSLEQVSNAADWILALHLANSLSLLNAAINNREITSIPSYVR